MPTKRMGPAARSFAADAHDCIMVRIQTDLPNTSVRREEMHPGLVHVISAMEACGAYQPWHDKRVAGTDKQGENLNLTLRVTDVYKKISGNWLVIHEHVSVPVDL